MSLDHIREHAQIQISAWQQQEIEALARHDGLHALKCRQSVAVLQAFVQSLEERTA